MPNPVVHWEIHVKDADEGQKFYSELFGWHVNADNPMNYGFVETHTEEGINGGIATDEQGANRVQIYVQVDDLQAYLDMAEGLGEKTVIPPTEIPGVVTLASFTDPEGNLIGLVKEDTSGG